MENRFFRLIGSLLVGSLLLISPLLAQVTNLSGTVNTYLDVMAVNTGANTVTLNSVAGLAVDDTVFIIQMKGATMNTTNAATFGDVSAINGAGKFEFNIICDIVGNVVTLQRMMLATYDPSAAVQLIPVVNYANANINATVTAMPWDGNLGGVVLISAPAGRVTFNANIDVSGRGFRGGLRQDMISGCSCANFSTQHTNYSYPIADWHGAQKAEGIALTTGGMESGKGKQVNGGGGGNDHNSGGAGGANYGAGGNGGNASASTCIIGSYCRGLNPGIGGLGLGATFYNNSEMRAFLGGGGGAGHYGNAAVGGGSPGGDGERGAGIVIILADSIVGNNFNILANGNNIGPLSAADGGGGGGAGGTIVLDVRAFHSSPLTAQVRGGNGANHSWGAGLNNCKGTGGGGGGGVVWFRGSANPPSISTNVVGGIAGVQGGASCTGLGNAGSTNGVDGAVLTLFSRPLNSITNPICVLPIELAYFTAEKAGRTAVNVNWRTTSEINNLRFEIERATDGIHYETIGRVASVSNHGEGSTYQWKDSAPAIGSNWYRLRQRDLDGRTTITEAVTVQFDGMPMLAIKGLYPNPVNAPDEMILELASPESQTVVITVSDIVGKTLYTVSLPIAAGNSSFRLPTQGMSSGIYFLKVSSGRYGDIVRKVKVN